MAATAAAPELRQDRATAVVPPRAKRPRRGRGQDLHPHHHRHPPGGSLPTCSSTARGRRAECDGPAAWPGLLLTTPGAPAGLARSWIHIRIRIQAAQGPRTRPTALPGPVGPPASLGHVRTAGSSGSRVHPWIRLGVRATDRIRIHTRPAGPPRPLGRIQRGVGMGMCFRLWPSAPGLVKSAGLTWATGQAEASRHSREWAAG